MSANDNELDYLHAPRGPVDRAITKVEGLIAKAESFLDINSQTRELFLAVASALRELDRNKRERY